MTTKGEIAYAHTRLRAWRSRLFRRADVMPLLSANDVAAHNRALAAIGAATDGEAIEHAYERLLRIYRIAIRGYRDHTLLFVALLRLHEVENVKLAWRATARHLEESRWRSLWRPLGSLSAVSFEKCRAAESLSDLAEHLADTPYGQVVALLFRAHGDDITAFELGIDRWASDQLLAEAAKLPASEGLAGAMIETLVRRRDAQLEARGERAYSLSRETVERESKREKVLDFPTLLRRASRGNPFSLAPALAVVLLAEEELRGVVALTERHGRSEVDEAIAQVLEPSLMGAHA